MTSLSDDKRTEIMIELSKIFEKHNLSNVETASFSLGFVMIAMSHLPKEKFMDLISAAWDEFRQRGLHELGK